MPNLGYYIRGTWNAQCDECGRGFKFSQLRKRWVGQWVCNTGTCWETRQPQDFVRGVKDDQSVAVARPRILPAPSPAIWANSNNSFADWRNSNKNLALWSNSGTTV